MEGEEQSSNKRNLPPAMRGSNEPWLVFMHGKRREYQTFYGVSEGNYHAKSIPLMRGKHICTFSHGWMVLGNSVSTEHCLLLNPTTMEKIQLPLSDFCYNKCVLTSSPTDPTCTVLFISCLGDGVMVFRFCNPHRNSGGKVDRWIKKEMKFDGMGKFVDATNINGKVFVFLPLGNSRHDILIIETSDEDTTLTVRKMGIEIPVFPLPDLPLAHSKRMVESCGEIYCVRSLYEEWYSPYETIDFEIFKLDFNRKCWERVKSIGNRAFFLGRRTSCSASAIKCSKTEYGIIFFTMEEDRSLYKFDIEDKSISICLPCPNVQNNWSQPEWFIPSCLDKKEE